MTTGRVLAARPRSANQTSPGCGFIDQIQNFLFYGSRPGQIENIVISEFNNLVDALSNVESRLWFPLPKFGVQLFKKRVH